ncbi:DUF932 domain-containing protein [Allochromatium palmeri]|uniref:DUF932 domain-containing protein n=1 Tax=Allochromatium palmeri TaxID=231048 RepID=A0A6N8EJE4_9GAMM|nr:DUF932 domain-containing protein [Allochromatium palmeri]MTW22627.1 DUF932 domain-containing protein [Allochromatium palmeri]
MSILNATQVQKPSVTKADDLLFPVELVPVGAIFDDGNYTRSNNYQAVVRTDTNEVLGIHGKGYNLLSNAEAFDAFDEALHESQLDLSGMTVKNEIANYGAKSFRTYTFPAHTVQVGRSDDETQLKLQIINSYDGSTSFSSRVGGFRLLCSNGMVIGKTFMHASIRHTKSLDIKSVISKLDETINVYLENANQWQQWSNQRISLYDLEAVVKHFAEGNEKLEQSLIENYHQEAQEIGQNLWALFNSFTHWTTHFPVREASQHNAASIRLNRELRVQRLLESNEWKRLAA